jgi:hypothetical protein
MPGVDADDPQDPFPLDDLAVPADFFDRCSDFHGLDPFYLKR